MERKDVLESWVLKVQMVRLEREDFLGCWGQWGHEVQMETKDALENWVQKVLLVHLDR